MAEPRLYKMITPPKFKGGGITVKVGDKVITSPEVSFAKSISATNSLGATVNSMAIMMKEMKTSFTTFTVSNMKLQESMFEKREEYMNDEKKRIKESKRAALRAAGLARDKASEKKQEKVDKDEDPKAISAVKKSIGFFEGIMKLIQGVFRSLLLYKLLEWIANPENRKKLISIFNSIKEMIKFFVQIADFLVEFGLSGLTDFLRNPISFKGIFGLVKFLTVIGAIFAPVALAKFGLALGGKILKLVAGGGLKKALMGLFRGIGGMIKGLLAFVKGRGLGKLLLIGAAVGTGMLIQKFMDDAADNKEEEEEGDVELESTAQTPDLTGTEEKKATGGPLKKFAAGGGWIQGPQSGYPVSLTGRGVDFIGHGTEYVATKKAAGGGIGSAFVVPYDTPATRGNPGLTNMRLAEASRSGFGLPGPYAKGGPVKLPEFFLGGLFDKASSAISGFGSGVMNTLGLGGQEMDPVLFGLAKKGVGMSVSMLGGNPAYWHKPESQRSIEDMARKVASKSQILKSGGLDKVEHTEKGPKSTAGTTQTGPEKIDIGKAFSNLGGSNLLGSYLKDAQQMSVGGLAKAGCNGPWCKNLPQFAGGGLLDFIASGEGGYNSMNQGTIGNSIVGSTHDSASIVKKKLTDMTVGEIMERQAYLMNKSNPQESDYGLFAVGRYQVIPGTMSSIVKTMGIDRNAKFDKPMQDKIGLGLIKHKRPYAWKYINKEHNDRTGAMKELAAEWASLPDPATGRSMYGGGNASSHSVEEVAAALDAARGGAPLVSDDPNLNLASAGPSSSTDSTGSPSGASDAGAQDKPKKIDIMDAFEKLGGKELLSSYFDDINADPDVGNPDMLKPKTENEKGEKLSEAELKEKEKEAKEGSEDNISIGDLNPKDVDTTIERPQPVVAGGGDLYTNPAFDFLTPRMGWLSDISTSPKSLT